MPSLKNVAYNERFSMYVCVPFGFADKLKKALKKAGFKKINEEDQGNEHVISVEVSCCDATAAWEIIDEIIG